MTRSTMYGFVAAVSLTIPTALFAESGAVETVAQPEEGYVQDTGAAYRIESADRLRTITQEVAAAACYLHNGIEVSLASEQAQHGLDQFSALTAALLEGDPALGIIGGEENPRARAMIERIQSEWMPVHAAVTQILADPSDAAAAEEVFGLSTAMLNMSMDVLAKIESVHVVPSQLLQADAMLMDIAGRQAMMTQRLSFLACKKWSGAGNATYDELLQSSAEQYAFGFQALLNGAPALGIAPPPNQEIRTALNEANTDFQTVIAKLDSLVGNEQLDNDRVGELYRILSAKMIEMEHIAHLYAEHSKRVY